MADIVLINPRFEVSFWGLENPIPCLGKRACSPLRLSPFSPHSRQVAHRCGDRRKRRADRLRPLCCHGHCWSHRDERAARPYA